MTDQQMINEFLAEKGATQCPPAKADGAKLDYYTAKKLRDERRSLRKEAAKARAEACNHNGG